MQKCNDTTLFQRFIDHCQEKEDAFFCRRTDWANWIWHWVNCVLSQPKAKLRDTTEQHSVNQSFCGSVPSTVQTRAAFDDVGSQISLNGTGWCNRRKDCVVVHRTGSWEQWNCKPAVQCKCCINQQLIMNVQHAAATSPAQWKNPSSWETKGQAAVKISTFLTYTYIRFHQCFFYSRTTQVQTMHRNVIWIDHYTEANIFVHVRWLK